MAGLGPAIHEVRLVPVRRHCCRGSPGHARRGAWRLTKKDERHDDEDRDENRAGPQHVAEEARDSGDPPSLAIA